MLFDKEEFQLMKEVKRLHEAAAKTGFTVSEIHSLVECELDTGDVLAYINAVVSKRMN